MNDHPHPPVQDMVLADLLDIAAFQDLSDSYAQISGLAIAILDLQGNILIHSGWQEICTDHHRKHPTTASRCLESDTELAGMLTQGQKFNMYQCKNGLIDVATPIFIENVHLGNLFAGQFLLQKPDIAFFSRQAEEYGFDKNHYLEALAQVPILSKDEINKTLAYLSNLTVVIGNAGLDKKRLLDLNKDLEKEISNRTFNLEGEKRFSESLINSLPGVMYLFDQTGHYLRWNQNFENFSGYSREEILRMNPLDFIATEDRQKAREVMAEVFEKGRASFEGGFATSSGEIVPYLFTGYKYIHKEVNYLIGVGVDISDRVKAENEKANVIKKLRDALSEAKQLSGLLPICASCKKVRDDKGYWNQLEAYVREHSEAEFSHSLCPDCSEKIYGNEPWYAGMKKESDPSDG